jgi:hypothetical protein
MFRRSAARFFGKTSKLDVTVTNRTPGRLPSPPRLAAAAVLATAVAWPAAAAPPGGKSVYSRRLANVPAPTAPAVAPAAPVSEEAARAERILASSLAMIAQADSFAAGVRQKVRVGDRVLVGTGRYLQSGRGEDQRYRFESTLTCDSLTFEMVEVCDGLFAWTYRHYGEDAPQLERRDVRRVRDRLTELKAADPLTTAPYLGGLQRSMGTLRQWFRFISAEPGEVEGTPVWVVDGRWSADWLNVILPDHAAAARRPEGIAPAELPDGVPWSVRFFIGRTDLVPYRVEWLAIPGPRPVVAGTPEPIGVLELLDVRIGGPVDAGAFVYKPAADGLIDLTEDHVKGMGLMQP